MVLSDWDLDLRAGEAGESQLADLLHADTIEVKTDRRWYQTGNLYVEYTCWHNATQEWKPSGLQVSKATHWAFMLEGLAIIIPTDQLKEAIKKWGREVSMSTPPNPTTGYLITPHELFEWIRRH